MTRKDNLDDMTRDLMRQSSGQKMRLALTVPTLAGIMTGLGAEYLAENGLEQLGVQDYESWGDLAGIGTGLAVGAGSFYHGMKSTEKLGDQNHDRYRSIVFGKHDD